MDIQEPVLSDAEQRGRFLVVGLGNPGDGYRRTRHNIGFHIIDAISCRYRIVMRHCGVSMRNIDAQIGEGVIEGKNVILMKPMAYMNLSGEPVSRILYHTSLSSRDMLVVHDDMDLSFGRIKIKSKGGSGGHNGVQSLIDALGGGDFNRLRIGIGHSGKGVSVVDYVLSPFTSEENDMMSCIVDRARDAVVTVLCNGAEAGMNRFNQTLITISSQTTDGGK